MITERDLQEAIAECQGQRNPTANTCIKLAAFYTIRNELFGKKEEKPGYSFAPAPDSTIRFESGSEFARAVNGRMQEEVFPLLDEMMAIIRAVHPKLYNAVLDRLK